MPALLANRPVSCRDTEDDALRAKRHSRTKPLNAVRHGGSAGGTRATLHSRAGAPFEMHHRWTADYDTSRRRRARSSTASRTSFLALLLHKKRTGARPVLPEIGELVSW